MKRIIATLLALALMLSLAVTAFAEGEEASSGSTSGEQAVQAKVPGPSWELVIPADQTIEYLAEVTDIVDTNCSIENPQHIPAYNTINATLTHTGIFTMTGDDSEKIAFTLRAFKQRDIAAGEPVIVSQYWSDLKETACYKDLDVMIPRATWEAAKAGTYTTLVTYTSKLANEITDSPVIGFER